MVAFLGCAGAGYEGEAPLAVRIVWPPPPEKGRIELTRILKGNAGLHAARSRIVRALVGKKVIALARPFGVAADEEGRILVADTDAPAVVLYDFPRRRLVRIVKFGREKLVSPIGVAFGPGGVPAGGGSIFVTDSVLGKILVFDRNGAFIHEFAPNAKLRRPTGITTEPGGERVLVADALADAVIVFDRSGRLERTIGGGGILYRPTDVWCDSNGTVFVTDTLNFRIQMFRLSDGARLGTFGVLGDASGTIRDPRGVAADRHGHVYVVDRAFSRVQIFDPRGRYLLSFGEHGRGPGQFDMPSDVFVDAEDRIYVSDSFNGRIQVFRLMEDSDKIKPLARNLE